MKKLFIISTALILFSCGIIDQNKAIDYNNSLIEEQEKVADEINEFIEMVTTADSLNHTIIQEKRKEVLSEIDNGINNVNEIGDFKNSSDFKESILNVLKAYRNGVANEYTEMANFMLLPIEEQTPERSFATESVAYRADSLISVAEGDFVEAQQIFATEHNIELAPAPASGY